MPDWSDPAAMWNERFAKPDPVYGSEPNVFLREQSRRLAPGAKVFVPGDGYGRNGIWLARQGFDVHSIDLSSVGVERARRTAAEAGVSLDAQQGDLSVFGVPHGAYDAVFAIFLHLPPEIRPVVHAKLLASLRPAGLLFLEAFTPQQLNYQSGGPKQVELLYTAALLRQDFAGAHFLQLEEVIADLEEGPLHSGKGAVVRVVASRG